MAPKISNSELHGQKLFSRVINTFCSVLTSVADFENYNNYQSVILKSERTRFHWKPLCSAGTTSAFLETNLNKILPLRALATIFQNSYYNNFEFEICLVKFCWNGWLLFHFARWLANWTVNFPFYRISISVPFLGFAKLYSIFHFIEFPFYRERTVPFYSIKYV